MNNQFVSTMLFLNEIQVCRIYDEFLSSYLLQFGFKKNSSCTHALFTVNESVNSVVNNTF